MHPYITKSACDITSYYIFSTFIHFYFKNNELSKIYHISKAIIFHTHTHTFFFLKQDTSLTLWWVLDLKE